MNKGLRPKMYPTKPELAFHLGLLAMTLVHLAQTTILDSASARHDPDLDDVIITDRDVDFDDVFTRSRLHCARLCSIRERCVAFTATPLAFTATPLAFTATPLAENATSDSTILCRGHACITSQMNRTSLPGSKTYVFASRPHASAWLETNCTDNSECWVSNSECYRNQCLCTPGYYYSHCADACVAKCSKSRIQSTFLRYPESLISSNNMAHQTVDSLDHCLDLCRNHSLCVTIDYLPLSNGCHLQSVTALDVPSSWVYRVNIEVHQKTCL